MKRTIGILVLILIVGLLLFGCTKPVPYQVSECQTSVEAAVKEAPMIQYTQNDLLDQCITDGAVKAKDISICEYVANSDSKATCITRVNAPTTTTPFQVTTMPNPSTNVTAATSCSNLLTESDLQGICEGGITIDRVTDDNSEIINGCVKVIYLSSPNMFIDVAIIGPRSENSVEENFNSFVAAQKEMNIFTKSEEISILGNRAWATETFNSATYSILLNDKQVDVVINERSNNGTAYPCSRDKLEELTKTVLSRVS